MGFSKASSTGFDFPLSVGMYLECSLFLNQISKLDISPGLSFYVCKGIVNLVDKSILCQILTFFATATFHMIDGLSTPRELSVQATVAAPSITYVRTLIKRTELFLIHIESLIACLL